MADRYTYIPMIGILLIVVWGIKDLAESLRLRPPPLLAMATVIAIVLVAVTRQNISYWQDGDTRWTRAATVCPNNWTAYANLGTILKSIEPDRALDCLEKSVEINPDYVEAQRELGSSLLKHKRYDEAIEHFRIAWTLNTDDPRTQWNWAGAYYMSGLTNEAIYHMQIAHAIEPDNPAYMPLLVDLLVENQRIPEAIQVLKSLCAVQTNNPTCFNKLGFLFIQNEQVNEGIQAFQTALNLEPTSPVLQKNLADAIRLKQNQKFQNSRSNGAAIARPSVR
jgi:tetratricopeptide (TPR) repeat protein